MENHPPEPEPTAGPSPVLEYATPQPKDPSQTPAFVRVIGMVMSVLALMLGLLCGFGVTFDLIDRVRRWDSLEVGDTVRFYSICAILISAGALGIRGAWKSRDRSNRSR